MKTNTNRKQLEAGCEVSFEHQLKSAAGQAEYQGLVRLIAQVLDAAASGMDVNLRIGVTKMRSAYIVTLYQEGDASYATGLDWPTLLAQVELLL